MDVSPYEGTVEVPVGNGGVVIMRERIPGGEREAADKVRTRVRSNAKAAQKDGKIAAEDISVETEIDEAAYHLALLCSFVVSWNLTRHGMPIPLSPPEAKAESIKGLPDPIYTPLVKKALELVEAATRTTEEQSQFRGGGADGGPYGLH
jgi:hypothetical protein